MLKFQISIFEKLTKTQHNRKAYILLKHNIMYMEEIIKIEYDEKQYKYIINQEHLIKTIYLFNADGIKYKLLQNREKSFSPADYMEKDKDGEEVRPIIETIKKTPIIAKLNKSTSDYFKLLIFNLTDLEFKVSFKADLLNTQYITTTKELYIYTPTIKENFKTYKRGEPKFKKIYDFRTFLNSEGIINKVPIHDYIEFNLKHLKPQRINKGVYNTRNKIILPKTSYETYKTPEEQIKYANIILKYCKNEILLNPLNDDKIIEFLKNPYVKVEIEREKKTKNNAEEENQETEEENEGENE